MKRIAAGFIAALFLAVMSSGALAQDRYERSERMRDGGPPPPRDGGPPPPPRGAGPPPPRHAVHGQPYFFIQGGVFEPNTDTDGLKFFDSGTNFAVGLGSRVSPVLAFEGAVGAYSTDKAGLEVDVVPVTIGIRLIAPSPFFEPYIGAGAGIYSADVDFPAVVNALGQPVLVVSDSDAVMGGYLSAGIDAWLNPRMALNFEGKYHWAEPSIGPVDVNVGGWTLNLGIRVSF